jgi:hypothetical protein
MIYGQNSSYGRAYFDALAQAAAQPVGGKLFLVAPTSHPNYSMMQSVFQPDNDGTPRLFSTLAAALAACVANRGDVVYLAEGYAETIVGAAGSGIAVAGVSVVGLGKGVLRPTFTFTTSTAASFDITAANVTVKNCVFTCGIDAQLAMINVSTADVTFDNCDFNTNSGSVGAVAGILTAATATRLVVVNSRFLGPATNAGTTTTAQIKHEAGVDYVIENNYFTGKMTQAIVNVATVLRGKINNNVFVVATGTVAIAVAAASTPMITNNRMNVASGTAPIVAAAGFVAGNTYSAAAGVTAGTASTI